MRLVLQLAEDVLGDSAHLAVAEDFLQLRGNPLEAHVAGLDQPFPLQDHVLSAGVDHRRDLAVGHAEHHVFDLLVAAVPADRVDHPFQAGAGGVLGVDLGEVAELLRLGRRLGLQLLRLLRIADGDQPDAHHLAVLRLEFLDQLLAADGQPFSRQLPQRQRRPDDVVGVLFGRDVSLLLEQFQPLVDGDVESLGHALDFRVHLGARHGNPLPLALLHDQQLVDHAFEHLFAAVPEALAGEVVAGDALGVHGGHHRRDGRRPEVFGFPTGGFARGRRGRAAGARGHALGRVRRTDRGGRGSLRRFRLLVGRIGVGRGRAPVVANGRTQRQQEQAGQQDLEPLSFRFLAAGKFRTRFGKRLGSWRFLLKPLFRNELRAPASAGACICGVAV